MGGIVLQYHQVVKGRFLRRPNRFIAHVETEDGLQICHVKNTGRCRELLVPGAAVYLEKAANSARKTAYDLIAVEKLSLIHICPHKRWIMWFNSKQREEPYQGLTSY